MKNYIYEAKIKDESTDEVLIKISSYSEGGLEEEMGKGKWTNAISSYENNRAIETDPEELDVITKINHPDPEEEGEDLAAEEAGHIEDNSKVGEKAK